MTFATFKKKFLKKRNILIALIAVELASFPAAAKIIERLSVSEAPAVSVVLIDAINGRKRFAVASNAPFFIQTDDLIGNVTVQIHKSGQIGQSRFGDNAQMPGVSLACSRVDEEEQVIYQSLRETSLDRGEILSQAVIVAIHYDEEISPSFHFDTGEADSHFAEQSDCRPILA